MTNTIAAWLAGLIVLLLVGDIALYGTEHMLFLAKKFYDFIEWVAFWR